MVFSSILFLYCFLPIFLVIYHLVGGRFKNIVLLVFSIVFYAWGAPKFVFFLLGSLTINFYIVEQMHKREGRRKILLVISLIINVGLLAYFKYANFFIENLNVLVNTIAGSEIKWMKVALPIGISFFTFQSITYSIDVYRNVHKPLKKLHDYLLYILMFPQLIAGPIVRFNTVADDITNREKNNTIDNKLYGLYLFVIGLSKKVLVANLLGEQVDTVFNSSSIGNYDSVTLWITIIAYSFQIYFDFSGYSDMAIGLGRIIGFKFPENFNNPYISQNITEFWRRWHITLGDWMKDYLYIPLGGNRVKSVKRIYFNLIIVFLISGFWHGANWTFIVWGAWHGLFLILDRLFLTRMLKGIGRLNRMILNYIVVLIGWVFFRSESLPESFYFIKKMFSFNINGYTWNYDWEFSFVILLALFISFSGMTKPGQKLQHLLYLEKRSLAGNMAMFLLSFVFVLLCTSYITASGFNPFIYFRF